MLHLRVVTYNVLSSSLCSPTYFTFCPDKFCSSKYRLDGLLKRLKGEVDRKSVICLQEVSLSWSATLHAFFDQADYTLVVSNYGHRFNGYMGVGVAFPRALYSLPASDITNVSDSKVGGWQIPNSKPAAATPTPAPVSPSFWKELLNRLVGAVRIVFTGLPVAALPAPAAKRFDDKPLWEGCRQRSNTLVTLRLRSKLHADLPDFLVSTYHMPCQFRDVRAMEIYALMCFQKVQQLSEGGKYLYILAGDFNFKPNSSQYAIATTGVLPETEEFGGPHPPKVYETDPFEYKLKLGGMKSAYKEAAGSEPEFTNYASTEGKEVFQDVLDYIFYSPQANKHKGAKPRLTCVAVDALPCEQVKLSPSLPNETEYSDHLLLAAEFELVADK